MATSLFLTGYTILIFLAVAAFFKQFWPKRAPRHGPVLLGLFAAAVIGGLSSFGIWYEASVPNYGALDRGPPAQPNP